MSPMDKMKNAFTLIELLVCVLILSVLVAIALPAYLSSIAASRLATANANAKSIATEIQALYVMTGGTDYTKVVGTSGFVGTYASTAKVDMGGSIPLNPCSGGSAMGTDYVVTSDAGGSTIQALATPNCQATTIYTLGTP